jgi:hypothetical protein
MSQKPSLEDEAFKLSEEVMIKAEAENGSNNDGHLPRINWRFSQASFRKLFKNFYCIKNMGRWFPKGAHLISIILISVTLFGSISVLGLLQSTESVSTLDINIPISSTPPTYPPPPPPPPEPKTVFTIYGDSSCTKAISEIKWGPIEIGGQVSKTIYVKNSCDQNITLSLYIENWDPVESSNYMNLSWDYDGSSVEPGSTIEVTLTLTVDPSTTEIEKFSFQILIIGSSS